MAKLVLTILMVFHIGVVTAASTVSINNYPPFGQQHGCVQNCLDSGGVFSDVGAGLSCDSPWFNNCYCPTASAAVASGILSSCVSRYCGAGDLPYDVTS